MNHTNYIIWNVNYYNKYEFSQKLSPYNFTWKSYSTSMTFQNITMDKPSHLYLASKPYLDPAANLKPYLAAWNPQQQALHTQWKSLNNRLFILNGPLSELSICSRASVSAFHVLLILLSFISMHMLLYPHCNNLPPDVVINIASKFTYKQHMLSKNFVAR